jgi:two-component system CheB/CheR fusion protein
LKSRLVGSAIQLLVEDTGCGIPPDVLPLVFNRFEQGNLSNEQRTAGIGLGLAIVRRLVELHGGTVQAASPGPGLGSTLCVTLPLQPAPLAGVGERTI